MKKGLIVVGMGLMFFAWSKMGVCFDEKDLLFYVPFEDSVQASFARGNGIPLTPNPEVFVFDRGRIGDAVVLGNTDAHLEYSLIDNLNKESGTISFWICPSFEQNEPIEGYKVLLSFGISNETALYVLFQYGKDYSYKLITFPMLQDGKWEYSSYFNASSWRSDEWHHIAVTWAEGNRGLYIDGVLVGQGTYKEPFPVGQVMAVGSLRWYPDKYFKGELDELYVFSKAIEEKTKDNVSAIYDAFTHEDLLFYVSFEDSVQASFARGNGIPLTPNPEVFVFDRGRIGDAVVLGNTDAHLEYSLIDNLNKKSGTISFWICPSFEQNEPIEGYKVLLSFGIPDEAALYVLFQYGKDYSYKLITFPMLQDGKWEYSSYFNASSWRSDEWHHIAVTWAEGNRGLYIDGVLVGQGTYKEPFPVAQVMAVGSLRWYPDKYFKGELDELYVFSKAIKHEICTVCYDGLTNETIGRAKVTLYNSNGTVYNGVSQANPGFSDEQGRLSFYVQPGKYYLTATAPGYEPYQSPFYDVVEGYILENVSLIPKRAGGINKIEYGEISGGPEANATIWYQTSQSEFASDILGEDLLFYVPFEDSVQASFARGNGIPLTPNPEVFIFDRGRIGDAVVLGNTDAHLEYSLIDNLNKESGTISFWICPSFEQNEPIEGYKVLLSFGIPNEAALYVLFQYGKDYSYKLITFPMLQDGKWEYSSYFNASSWRSDEWHHIAVTWAEGNRGLYIDGVLAGQGTYKEPFPVAQVMAVGSLRWYPDKYFKGELDELYIFPKAIEGETMVPDKIRNVFQNVDITGDPGTVRVRGGFSSGSITTRNINSSGKNIAIIRLDWSDETRINSSITYSASNDGGRTWHILSDNEPFIFPTAGNDLRIKAELSIIFPVITPILKSWKAFYSTDASTGMATWRAYWAGDSTDITSGNIDQRTVGAVINRYWHGQVGGTLKRRWQIGDDRVVVIDMEKDGGTINHKGYYGVINGTLDNSSPQAHPSCIIREMPIPVASKSGGVVTLTWSSAAEDIGNPPITNINGYNIFRSEDGINFMQINNTTIAGRTYDDNTVVSGSTYYYAIGIVFRGTPNVSSLYYSGNSNVVSW